jgi:hypothetical protein
MRGYSLQQHRGNWVMRWSVYRNGKWTQPTYIVASVRNSGPIDSLSYTAFESSVRFLEYVYKKLGFFG